MNYSLGLVEVSSLGNAIIMLDEMLKVADVEFTSVERKLGGRLVTVVVRGSISSVTASVEAGRVCAGKMGCLKSAEVIARPHPEILKFLNLEEKKPENATEKKPVQAEKTPEKPAVKTESKAKKASEIKKAPPKAGKKTK